MKKFNDLLIDPMGFGHISEMQQNAVYLEKDCNWGGDEEYMIYLGPCNEENTLSDSVSFIDDFIKSNLIGVGINNYELHCSENAHILHFDNIEDADDKFDQLVNRFISNGYLIKN